MVPPHGRSAAKGLQPRASRIQPDLRQCFCHLQLSTFASCKISTFVGRKSKKWKKVSENIRPEIWSWPCGARQLGDKAPSPPRARAGKAPSNPNVLQAVLVKIVTEILFWQCAFGGLWNNHLGSRSQTSSFLFQSRGETFTKGVCCVVLLNQYWKINVRSRGFFTSEPREHVPTIENCRRTTSVTKDSFN